MKTCKKTLAVVLSLLMLFSLCSVAFAEAEDGYTELPTSDEGLGDGDYWFDKDGFLALVILGLDPEEGNYAQEVAALETVTIYLSDDANELLVYFFGSFAYYIDLTDPMSSEEDVVWFLRQVGAPHEHRFVRIDTDTMNIFPGGYWYDSAKLAKALGDDHYRVAHVYRCIDNDALKFILYDNHGDEEATVIVDSEDPDWDLYISFLRVFPGFFEEPLPTSPEGLEDGAYWFDLASLTFTGSVLNGYMEWYMEAIGTSQVYLGTDLSLIRLKYTQQSPTGIAYMNKYDVCPGSDWYLYLRTVGVDPLDGFTALPCADSDDLETGDYWFDLANFEMMEMLDEEQIALLEDADFYLNAAANTIAIDFGNGILGMDYNVTEVDDFTDTTFTFLKQHGVAPQGPEGSVYLYHSIQDVPIGGGWYFDTPAYIDAEIEAENASLVEQGFDPLSEERELTYRAQMESQMAMDQMFYNPDTGVLTVITHGSTFEMTPEELEEIGLAEFIKYFDPWINVFLTTDGLTADAYWFDTAKHAGMVFTKIEIKSGLTAIRVTEIVTTGDGEETVVHVLTPEGVGEQDYLYYDTFAGDIFLTFAHSKESTCKAAGYENAIAIERNGETEILVAGTALPLKDHTPGEAVKENDFPATCNDYGSYEMVTYCTVCGDELNREPGEYGAYADHTPGEAVKENDTPSTCNTYGGCDLVTYCTVCGNELSREHVDYTAYGEHSWGEWTVTREPTEEEDGLREHTCAACGATESEFISSDEPYVCPWCGEIHTGILGFIISFLHDLLFVMKQLTFGFAKYMVS